MTATRVSVRVGFALVVLPFWAATASAGSIYSKQSAGPAAALVGDRTGSPLSESTCQLCHGTGGEFSPTVVSMTITLGGQAATEYIPGQTYQIGVSVNESQGSPAGWGFQMVALRDADNTNAGTLSNNQPTADTHLEVLNGVTYFEHDRIAQVRDFTVDWTAPPAGTGSVTFYTMGNAVNGNGAPDGIGGVGDSPSEPITFTMTEGQGMMPGTDINQGVAGAWFNANTAGQGFLFDVEPASNFMFVAWFTYDDASTKVGSPDHRWLTAQGVYDGSEAPMDLFSTSGGLFDDPQGVSTQQVGTLNFHLDDCSNASVSYDLPNDGLRGDIALTRVIPGTEALCEALDGQ